MNNLFRLLYFPLIFVLVSCGNVDNSGKIVGAVKKTDHCEVNQKNTYEVYIPERKDQAEKLPLLIIIDAHGSGKFALNKFIPGADQYQVMIVASNYIKNGFENYTGAIQTLISDVHQKYPAGETLFMAGFSGGARMALGYALSHQPNGLILCGALADANQINVLHCPVISISGLDDFNFVETAQYLFQDNLIPANLKIDLTNASHDWPDSLMLTNAVGFLRLSLHSQNIPSLPKQQFKMYCENQMIRIDTLKKQKDFLKAALVARNMSTTVPFSNDKTFASDYNDLKSNSTYISQLNQ